MGGFLNPPLSPSCYTEIGLYGLCSLSVLTLSALLCLLQEPPVAELLKRLRSDRLDVREEAMRLLIELGPKARAPVEGLSGDPDPETASRALKILEAIDTRVDLLLTAITRAVEQTKPAAGPMLREATKQATRISLAREWRDVRKVLQDGRRPVLHSQHVQTGETFSSTIQYVVEPAAYQEGGVAFDLVLTFKNRIETSEIQRTREVVGAVEVSLLHQGATMTKALLQRNPFPDGSLLHRWVDHGPFRIEASKAPILSQIKISVEDGRGMGIQPTLTSLDGSHRWTYSYWAGDPPGEAFIAGETSTWTPAKWTEWTLVEAETQALRNRKGQEHGHEARIDVYNLPDLQDVPDSATRIRLRWPDLMDEHLPLLARRQNLVEINLTSTHITEEGFKQFLGMENLKHLTLYHAKGITDAGCAVLSQHPRISFLHLSECSRMSDDGLRNLTKARGLRTLVLGSKGGERISDQGILALKELPHLEELRLWSMSRVSNVGLAHLRDFPALRHLLLAYLPGVDDDGLRLLSASPVLQHLELIELPITDKGVDALKGLTGALSVRINQCEAVSRKGVDAFTNGHPKKWIVK